MIGVNDYCEEKTCIYKGETYRVRDNGAVLREAPTNQKARPLDNKWTFGKANTRNAYLFLGNHRVHCIVATAFYGEAPTKSHVVDHRDTNRANNRPDNLRWATRLENALNNESTRRKIEYLTGVSIYEFLESPSKYRECFSDSDYSWMRRVSEGEAKACLENLKKLNEREPSRQHQSSSKMGEWVFYVRDPDVKMEQMLKAHRVSQEEVLGTDDIIDSLTPMAKQKNWKTPTKFVCCPEKIEGDPIACYLGNLSENAIFQTNRHGNSKIVKYAEKDKNAIVVITSMPSGVKSFALAKITYENGYYLHSSLGTFFTKEGAEKQFTLEQGLEWTGGDTIDDYC